MKTRILAAFAAAAALAMAQKPKSKSEAEALMAIQGEADPTAKIAKIDAFISKYADSEFKEWAYTRAAEAADSLGDGSKMIIYCDLAIEANPKAYAPMLMEAAQLARTTRENDLDKDEKLAKADKLVHTAMDILPTAPKVYVQLTDDQWDQTKKDYMGDAHRDLGMIAAVRKKYDVAIAEYKLAIETSVHPDPPTFIRLATAYNDAKQPDEALAVLAKMPNVPQLAPFVEKEKQRAEALKAGKK